MERTLIDSKKAEIMEIQKIENSKSCVWWSCFTNGAKHEFYWELHTDAVLVTKKRSGGLIVEWKIYPDESTAASVRKCINNFLKEV